MESIPPVTQQLSFPTSDTFYSSNNYNCHVPMTICNVPNPSSTRNSVGEREIVPRVKSLDQVDSITFCRLFARCHSQELASTQHFLHIPSCMRWTRRHVNHLPLPTGSVRSQRGTAALSLAKKSLPPTPVSGRLSPPIHLLLMCPPVLTIC